MAWSKLQAGSTEELEWKQLVGGTCETRLSGIEAGRKRVCCQCGANAFSMIACLRLESCLNSSSDFCLSNVN